MLKKPKGSPMLTMNRSVMGTCAFLGVIGVFANQLLFIKAWPARDEHTPAAPFQLQRTSVSACPPTN